MNIFIKYLRMLYHLIEAFGRFYQVFDAISTGNHRHSFDVWDEDFCIQTTASQFEALIMAY